MVLLLCVLWPSYVIEEHDATNDDDARTCVLAERGELILHSLYVMPSLCAGPFSLSLSLSLSLSQLSHATAEIQRERAFLLSYSYVAQSESCFLLS